MHIHSVQHICCHGDLCLYISSSYHYAVQVRGWLMYSMAEFLMLSYNINCVLLLLIRILANCRLCLFNSCFADMNNAGCQTFVILGTHTT